MSAQPRTTDTRKLASQTPASALTPTPQPAVATATPLPARTPAVRYDIYVVKKGDTMYSIARQFGTDVATLQSMNRIADPTTLYVGQELRVPKPTATPNAAKTQPKAGIKTYVVKTGDTLSSISRKFGVSVVTLQQLNNFANPNELKVGMTILVPENAKSFQVAGKMTPTAATRQPAAVEKTTVATLAPVAMQAGPTATPTAAPVPAISSVCGQDMEAVFVWGVSFCVPQGWTLQEYVEPHRTALLTYDETNGDRSVYAISWLEGAANAPLSWTMRQAKKAVMQEIAGLIPGRLDDPETWSSGEPVTIAGVQGQMSESESVYLQSNRQARVRVIVFNHEGKRWRIIIVAPESRWQSYGLSVFPYIASTMEVY